MVGSIHKIVLVDFVETTLIRQVSQVKVRRIK